MNWKWVSGIVVAGVAVVMLGRLGLDTEQESLVMECQRDLAALPDFLLENDTGATDHLQQKGRKHFTHAMTQARAAADRVSTRSECDKVLNRYLQAYRGTHLWLMALHDGGPSWEESWQAQTTSTPTIEPLTKDTLLLTLPGFAHAQGEALAALMTEKETTLSAYPNWIIDIRNNGGGTDSSFQPLLPYLLSDELYLPGIELLSSSNTLDGYGAMCARFMDDLASCQRMVEPRIAALAQTPHGQYTTAGEDSMRTFRVPAAASQPQRVAVLIDQGCGSSCESFALMARQGFAVKLLGRPTIGALDYSNMVPWILPSEQRELFYASSRRMALPEYSVDIAGVAPDIYLPKPQDPEQEIEQVRRWLEGGSLQPVMADAD
ncbi:S41 family peptidase [Ferrimonas pelagia]